MLQKLLLTLCLIAFSSYSALGNVLVTEAKPAAKLTKQIPRAPQAACLSSECPTSSHYIFSGNYCRDYLACNERFHFSCDSLDHRYRN
jgi:hypothetical protein